MISLLFFSLLVPISFIANGSTIYFVFGFIGAAAFFFGSFKAKNENIISNIVGILVLIVLFSLSCINGGSLHLAILKAVQFYILLKIAFVNDCRVVCLKNIQQIYFTYFVFSILFSPFSIINLPPGEPIRFTGFFFDPNYFGATCLLLLIVSNFLESEKNIKFRTYNYLLSIGILLSLSATIYFISFFYYVLSTCVNQKFINKFSVPFVILGLMAFPFAPFLVESIIFSINQFDDMPLSILVFKLASINQRFEVQVSALMMIFENPWNFVFGFGTGRTLEFLPRALHNGYLQLLFAHGIIVYSLFILSNLLLLNLIKKRLSGEKHVIIGFYSLLLINNFLDVFFSGLISILFFLLHYGSSSSLPFTRRSSKAGF